MVSYNDGQVQEGIPVDRVVTTIDNRFHQAFDVVAVSLISEQPYGDGASVHNGSQHRSQRRNLVDKVVDVRKRVLEAGMMIWDWSSLGNANVRIIDDLKVALQLAVGIVISRAFAATELGKGGGKLRDDGKEGLRFFTPGKELIGDRVGKGTFLAALALLGQSSVLTELRGQLVCRHNLANVSWRRSETHGWHLASW
jgi:hypothetical protein